MTINKTEIEWCTDTWNPLTGCWYKCVYCYARRHAERFMLRNIDTSDVFKGRVIIDDPEYPEAEACVLLEDKYRRNGKVKSYPFGFVPTFHKYRLVEPALMKKPATIFVCSMADLFGDWVPNEWKDDIFEACLIAPQHNYLFLTKNVWGYSETWGLPEGDNFWFGTTITAQTDVCRISALPARNTFISIEPIKEEIFLSPFSPQWVIVGAESGNRKAKVVPKIEWLDEIARFCMIRNIPLFMKNSLAPIWTGPLIQQFPEGINVEKK